MPRGTTAAKRSRGPSAAAGRERSNAPADGESILREAYFSLGARAARRLHVSADEVVRHALETGLPPARWQGPWIEDMVLATACARGDQEAWSELTLAHAWRLREAARDVLSTHEVALLVTRFFAVLRKGEHESIRHYDGRHSLAYWLGARFAISIGSRLPNLSAKELDLRRASRSLSLPSEAPLADDRLAT
ncbi:MAG: hypothetical protein O2819_01910 [Planctomycetota bacterium]|nr:hypothetical protein [Planctomycetota bacterium]MDA1105505.1 hypothetical protein [Planctomycetota bacterium]